jgi:hypothetical protein
MKMRKKSDVCIFYKYSQKYSEKKQLQCAMGKLPFAFSDENSKYALFPGQSMNESYMIVLLSMILMQFHLNYVQTRMAWKTILIACINITLLVLTAIYAWLWDCGYGSTFLGIFFIAFSMSKSWGFLYQERHRFKKFLGQPTMESTNPDGHGGWGMSMIEHAFETETSMEFHTMKSMCTFPLMVYIITFKMYAGYIDFYYTSILFTAFLVSYSSFLVESKLLVPYVIRYNFKFEKIVYSLTFIMLLVTFMYLYTAGADMFNMYAEKTASSDDARTLYITLFSFKVFEFGCNLLVYLMDDFYTYEVIFFVFCALRMRVCLC